MAGTRFSLEVQPQIPEKLSRLAELANDLLYSWDRGVRGLFYRLDTALWQSCNHNPKLFLRRVAQTRLEEAARRAGLSRPWETRRENYLHQAEHRSTGAQPLR